MGELVVLDTEELRLKFLREATDKDLEIAERYWVMETKRGRKAGFGLAVAFEEAKIKYPEWFWDGPLAEAARVLIMQNRLAGYVYTEQELEDYRRFVEGEVTPEEFRQKWAQHPDLGDSRFDLLWQADEQIYNPVYPE